MAVIERDEAFNWPATTAFIALSYFLGRFLYNIYLHPLSNVPGPISWSGSRLPFVRSLIRGNIVHDMEKISRKYGPVVRVAPNEVTFAHPDAWNDILVVRPKRQQFLKDQFWWKTIPRDAPKSLMTIIDPDRHARLRKTLAPGFTSRALIAHQEPILHRYIDLLVDRLRERESKSSRGWAEVDIMPWLMYTTFDIFGDLGFGDSFHCLQNGAYHPWIALIFNTLHTACLISAANYYPWISNMLMKLIPPSMMRKAQEHSRQVAAKVEKRLNYEHEREDVMSYLLKDPEDMKLSHGEIIANFKSITTAGAETSATVLSGTLNYLVNNPEKLSLLVDEIHQTFQHQDQITLDTVRDLPYLNATLNEGLRLCPPVPWLLPRLVPPGGETVCGIWLPGGTTVSVQVYTMNRDPTRFHRATDFCPERWLPNAVTDCKSPFFHDQREVVKSFSVGPRSCLGQPLAWAEMRLIMTKLLWNFEFGMVEGKKQEWEDMRTFMLVEKKPIMVKFRCRDMHEKRHSH